MSPKWLDYQIELNQKAIQWHKDHGKKYETLELEHLLKIANK
jgi:hypothetical protein